jgi:hypothetical protein
MVCNQSPGMIDWLLELGAARVARPVLRGGGGSDATSLPNHITAPFPSVRDVCGDRSTGWQPLTQRRPARWTYWRCHALLPRPGTPHVGNSTRSGRGRGGERLGAGVPVARPPVRRRMQRFTPVASEMPCHILPPRLSSNSRSINRLSLWHDPCFLL